MRILLVCGSFPPMWCGTGEYTLQLANGIAAIEGTELAVLTSSKTEGHHSETSFLLLPLIQNWSLRELPMILGEIRSFQPDIVHFQLPAIADANKLLPWLLPYLVASRTKAKVVQTWHFIFDNGTRTAEWRMLFWSFCVGIVPGGLITLHESYIGRVGRQFRWILKNKLVETIETTALTPSVDLKHQEREDIRRIYIKPGKRMVVFFGFLLPHKRAELLFEIADPDDTHVVICGGTFCEADLKLIRSRRARKAIANYPDFLQMCADTERWRDKVTFTGFIRDDEAARVMAAADAVILPFLGYPEPFSTTLRAAQAQGTFVLTTSRHSAGYDAEKNTYYADENDVGEMAEALRKYIGKRVLVQNPVDEQLRKKSRCHHNFYGKVLASG